MNAHAGAGCPARLAGRWSMRSLRPSVPLGSRTCRRMIHPDCNDGMRLSSLAPPIPDGGGYSRIFRRRLPAYEGGARWQSRYGRRLGQAGLGRPTAQGAAQVTSWTVASSALWGPFTAPSVSRRERTVEQRPTWSMRAAPDADTNRRGTDRGRCIGVAAWLTLATFSGASPGRA
jgi:hypothetical protein